MILLLIHGEKHMNVDEYDENVKELVNQVLIARIGNPDLSKKNCRKIIDLGKKNNDSKLLGFAYYYLAEAYFDENEYNKFIKYLILGLEYQHEVPLGGILARSYNMLGINSDNQGNIPAAIDYYLTSLKYSKQYGLNYEAGLANTNIGMIYALLKDYITAIQYFEKALTCFRKEKDNSHNLINEVITETTLATCYYRLGDMESALNLFYKIEKNREKYLDETHYQMIIYIFEVTIYNALEEFEKRDELIDRLIVLLDEIPSLLDMYDEAFALCEFLKETNRYDNLWSVLIRMEKLSKQAGITNMQLRVLRLKMQYFKTLQNETAYLLACADYYQMSEQLEVENKTIAKRSIELRMDLERVREKQTLIQEENKVLLEKSERDPLTKLPNRDKLNDYSEIAFDQAFQNGTSLAVEVLDIDCFKQYNDTYGHQAGDKCLKKIAQLLHILMEEGIFCARYGGDEFIIIYENKTDDEILEIARKLQQDVVALNLKNKNAIGDPYVTISQGIRNSVPQNGNKIWDYFYVADVAMYQVKRTKKNDISLVHKSNTQ
jgi:diguanylate cyclase (GGDEF)-like protein